MSLLSTAIAFTQAYALESAFHFAALIVESLRRDGTVALNPEVIPFRSAPLCEALASCFAALALVLGYGWAWVSFDVAIAAHVAAYLWVETGVDLVGVAFLLFVAPAVSRFALAASLVLLAGLLMRPVEHVNAALWHSCAFLVLLTLTRVCAATGWTLAATALLGTAVEVASEAFRRRMYGPSLVAPSTIHPFFDVVMWMLIGVRLVDAGDWLGYTPQTTTDLPPGVHGAFVFCQSGLVRAIRFHTGRVTEANRVAIAIGEWDEIAFAPTPGGFVLALLASLRVPMSLRAVIDDAGTELSDLRLVVCFVELAPSVWRRLTGPDPAASREAACMVKGKTLLLPSRLTLRRVTEALLSWTLLSA